MTVHTQHGISSAATQMEKEVMVYERKHACFRQHFELLSNHQHHRANQRTVFHLYGVCTIEMTAVLIYSAFIR